MLVRFQPPQLDNGSHPAATNLRLKAENETRALIERQKAAEALEQHPGLLRLAEIEALRGLARNGNARVYMGFGQGVLKIGDTDGRRE